MARRSDGVGELNGLALVTGRVWDGPRMGQGQCVEILTPVRCGGDRGGGVSRVHGSMDGTR